MQAGSAASGRVYSINSGWKILWRDVSFPFPGLSSMGERRTGLQWCCWGHWGCSKISRSFGISKSVFILSSELRVSSRLLEHRVCRQTCVWATSGAVNRCLQQQMQGLDCHKHLIPCMGLHDARLC